MEPFSGLLTSRSLRRGAGPKEATEDDESSFPKHRGPLALVGAALLSTAASATDFSEGANFGGAYGYIGPGVASLPDLDVDIGPLGAGVYVEPGIAFNSPGMDYASPASTWAPVYPQAQLEVVPAVPGSNEPGLEAMGAEPGQ